MASWEGNDGSPICVWIPSLKFSLEQTEQGSPLPDLLLALIAPPSSVTGLCVVSPLPTRCGSLLRPFFSCVSQHLLALAAVSVSVE